VNQASFRALEHINPLSKLALTKLHAKSPDGSEQLTVIDLKKVNVAEELSHSWSSVEFFIYKLNVVDMLAVSKIKTRQLLQNLRFNLTLLTNLIEEDIVGFDRSYYYHLDVVTCRL
jgi:hypothetical protein